jgi:cyclic beta-1,2-glucan synthetase
LKAGILTAFFVRRDDARRALKALRRKGFRRAALIHKASNASVSVADPFPGRRALATVLAGILSAALVGFAVWALGRYWPLFFAHASVASSMIVAALIGALAGWAWMRRSVYGVERRLLVEHSRWLATEESVLILQAPIELMRLPVANLRESGEMSPVVSVLNPKREGPVEDSGSLDAPLTTSQSQERGRRLAMDDRVGIRRRRAARLLDELAGAERWMRLACSDLSNAGLLERRTTPIAEWILDNEYVIEGNLRDVRQNLSRRFYRSLPVLASRPHRGLPRIYGLAKELVSHAGLRLDRENIVAFVEAYQSLSVLTIAELWAIPQMLRIALIEGVEELASRGLAELRDREIADFWANRLIAANRRGPNHLFSIMAELTENRTSPSSYFAFQLIDHLFDEEAALAPVRSWLERVYRKPLGELASREQNRQTKDQISIGNAITSLRQLALLDWRKIFEDLSHVERTLRLDPSGIYAGMDFATRDRYRRAVEELARRSGKSEVSVARIALDLSARAMADKAEDERRGHVGTCLIGEGRREFGLAIGCREGARFRVLAWAYRRHSSLFFFALGFFFALFMALAVLSGLCGQPPGIAILMALLLAVPLSQISLETVNYLVIRILPPRDLAKMDFEAPGIPAEFRTLVVVPMMLANPATISSEVEKLEIRYLANREGNLLFSLFTDYSDSEEERSDADEALLAQVVSGLEALNARYGGERFFLFHRERKWSETEGKFIGWERKRGKLEELNRLIDGTRPEGSPRLVYVGEAERLAGVRFVITLDSDTQLLPGSARRLVETLAHPLNRPRFDAAGKILAGTYTIIQPRVSPSLPSASASVFSRLFSYSAGIDPYTKTVSDVNQDLTGEGSYHGKGIYDVRAFSRALSGRFPEELLLSHDLIEGAHVRVGLASDIELLDEFPRDYLGYARRQHRWTRGDWQIADWILPRVPLPGGGRGPNALSWFDRWKILDNLRRSLVPAASLALLATGWLVSPHMAWISAIAVAAQLFFQTLAKPFTSATTIHGLRGLSFPKLALDFARTIAEASLIPQAAWLALDAITRVSYRRLASRRHLLEWTQSRKERSSLLASLPIYLSSMGLIGLSSAAAGWALMRWAPAAFPAAAPWLGLWLLSPLIGWLLNLGSGSESLPSPFPERDLRYLRKTARKTWRYFSDFVSPESSWLPPDNYQVFHQNELAMRTSPTNIGLWMLSALAARDFGYLTVDQVVERLTLTMGTIAKLERYKGHLLNWYELGSLKALEPRYVSTVDSGNLLGALWSLERGLGELLDRPVMDESRDEALRDAKAISEEDGDSAYWAGQAKKEELAWLAIANRYLAWREPLAEKTEAELSALGEEAIVAIRRDRRQAPSLRDLAEGKVGCISILRSIRDRREPSAAPLAEWLDRVVRAFDTSKWLAGETMGQADRLIDDIRKLSESIDMRFLYDSRRELFAVGFKVSYHRLDNAFYDLLASESRVGSFVAIARGEVPAEHWFSLGRPYAAIGRRRALLSWTGTMFEYLMPLLLQRSYGRSLLDKAARDAVAIHIGYGRKFRLPWGISESAFTDLDANKTYQYKAFGVPALGLKRGQEEELVVAPYASVLALGVSPRKAVSNLKRLSSLGLMDEYGFYEAIDFSRQSSRLGGRGEIVRTYMSHHQSMLFLSLCNFLHGDPIRRHFHADPRVRAFESLLQESIPLSPPLYRASPRQRVPLAGAIDEISPSASGFDTPFTTRPKTQLLGNGRYSLMVTNSGSGYSRWGDFEITRWRSDRTRDPWGSSCYIREADSNRLWSNAYHPADGRLESYSASFALDRAVFRRVDNGIEVETEVVVSSEDDVEIRRITLINRSLRTRQLELTSYAELSLASHRADLQHPAFNKIFIQTEGLRDHRALLAYRRRRGEDDPQIYVAHRFTLDRPDDERFRFETDRRLFIGRGRTLENPIGVYSEPSGGQGFVLDPIFSLRHGIALSPGERSRVSFILAASDSRQGALSLMEKYADPHAIDRAMDFAWASAQVDLRLLRIQGDEARRFQELAGHLIFPNPLLRPPAERIEENRMGQAGLWSYGISGDLPIALVSIAETRDIAVVRQMLQAHAYWRKHGLKADLVILNEEESGYEQPLREQLERLIRTHASIESKDRDGRVFLQSSHQLHKEDLSLFMASARVVLVAARGALAQQSGVEAEIPEPPDFRPRKRAAHEASASLPFMELPYFNGLGGFSPDGREYVIYLGPETNTPAPWVNVIANPSFGTLASETGSGFSWYGNSQRNRLTEWSNDPVTDPPSEVLYVRDEETGSYWTPTAAPIRDDSAYRARHGAGYTVFEHNCRGIEQELTVFVPVDEEGGDPIKLQRLRLRNGSSRARTLSVTYYVEWTLGESRDSSQMHVSTAWNDDAHALYARNRYHPEYGDRVAFAAISPQASSFDGDRGSFVGRNRSLARPAAMERARLSSRTGTGLDPCAALQTLVAIAPGETAEIVCMMGQAGSGEEARSLVLKYRSGAAMEKALEGTKAWWDELLGTVEAHTPELAADFLINRWLLYQSLGCRMWGRAATYQPGGAFGFRDQLQDAMAFLFIRPEIARKHILLAASRQFKEGDVQHWWHPPTGAGVRSRISDDLLWLPYVVSAYVRVSGDKGILEEQIPFLQAPSLAMDQRELYITPGLAAEGGTLFEHCRRALARGSTTGAHGLPLIGTGDWNDGLNLVGAEGKGESVWLGWFLAEALKGMIELSDSIGRPDLGRDYAEARTDLVRRIEQSGWDGAWYLRAYFDDGTLLGSDANAEMKIDSLPQSWAVLSGAAEPDRAKLALESAWGRLVLEQEGLVLLFEPPFDAMEPSPGYIKGYPPGVRENGGQYTHAALWLVMALARRGDGERAVKLLRMLNPIERAGNLDSAWHYALEPYAIAADIYRLPGRVGQGGWSWYTGSAAWMYRAWVEGVLGMKIRGDSLRLDPAIPRSWKTFSLSYRRGEAVYEIRVENPEGLERGVAWVEMDGLRQEGGDIPLERTPIRRKILVHMGSSE